MTKEEIIKKLTELKGIGEEKAEKIYEKGFDTEAKIRNATIEELSSIEGIGKKTAEKLQEEIQKTFPEVKAEKETKKEKPEKSTAEEETVEEKEEEEEVEIIEEETETGEGYHVKKKPKLTEEQKRQLSERKKIKNKKPEFVRQESFRHKRIPGNWRRPKGMHSKMRLNRKYRPGKVRVGYRAPKKTRGLHPSGFEEVKVNNVNDLEKINPDSQAARIGGTVGTKKRIKIKEKAKEQDIRILNP